MATIISGDTGVNKITDGSVATADLASTLDLSGKTMTYGNLPAANLTGTLPAIDGSNLTGVSGGPTVKYVTDSTDVSVTAAANVGYSTIGSTFSVDIPTSGSFEVKQVVMKLRNDVADYATPALGLRIGSTNYWFGVEGSSVFGGTEIVPFAVGHSPGLNDTCTLYSGPGSFVLSNGQRYGSNPIRDIVESGIPTGTQTVQLVVAKPYWSGAYGDNFTILGTSVTTRVAIEFTEYS